MGVDLMGRGGESFNWESWRTSLKVAQSFGWRPSGTAPPTDQVGDWDGTYFSNDLQDVTDDDAKELARALFRALDAVHSDQALSSDQVEALQEASLGLINRLAIYAYRGGFTIS